MAELSFDRLYEYFTKVPSIQKNLIDAYGTDGKSAWWFKFQIDVDHPWHGKRYKSWDMY